MIDLNDYNYKVGFVSNHSIYKNPLETIEDQKTTDFINYYSQNGEDGVLEKIFDVLDIKEGTFINGGCDDIYDHSNVRRLVSLFGWRGLFIEPNLKMLEQGRNYLLNDERITTSGSEIKYHFHCGLLSQNKESERIGNIIEKYYADKNLFDLVTLHIDSYEYWVLEDFLKGHYDAKVILIGYNFSRDDSVTVPKESPPKIGHQSITDNFYSASAPALTKLAKEYGFQLVSVCKPNNLIFVHKRFNKNLFKVCDPLEKKDYFWEGDSYTNNRRKYVTDGWVKV